MGAIPANTSAIEELNNTLTSGTFIEKWRATWALDIINTENILKEYTEKQNQERAKLQSASKVPSWDEVAFDTNLAVPYNSTREFLVDLIKQGIRDPAKISYAIPLLTIGALKRDEWGGLGGIADDVFTWIRSFGGAISGQSADYGTAYGAGLIERPTWMLNTTLLPALTEALE
ncbi:hypothetical protein IIY59_01090 [Candidatus Saccharibacteria bacterium]|nr:hypothetical protein [Candidatus Saccharibacteria bacterium]